MTYKRKNTPPGPKRKYSAQHVQQWRDMMRVEKLTLSALETRTGVPVSTLHRLMTLDARGEL